MITSPKTSAIPTVPRAPPYWALVTTAPAPAKTRAKAANASAPARRPRSGRGTVSGGSELVEKDFDASGYLVADPPHSLDVLSRRILEIPIQVALARIYR